MKASAGFYRTGLQAGDLKCEPQGGQICTLGLMAMPPGRFHAGETTYRTHWLAKGPGGEDEAQAKFSPDGLKAYVAHTDIGPYPIADMDTYFARIMPYDFPQNQAPAVAVTSTQLLP